MIHINSGLLKGLRLSVPDSGKTRPTKSGIREALFNIMGHNLNGMSFCDLCAGSGAVGFEAASRGAERVVFVEKEFKMSRILAENITKATERLHEKCQLQLFTRDFRPFINCCEEKFDLIYFDPPYIFYRTRAIPENIENIIADSGILVMEHTKENPRNLPENFGNLQLIKAKNYGKSILSFFQKK